MGGVVCATAPFKALEFWLSGGFAPTGKVMRLIHPTPARFTNSFAPRDKLIGFMLIFLNEALLKTLALRAE